MRHQVRPGVDDHAARAVLKRLLGDYRAHELDGVVDDRPPRLKHETSSVALLANGCRHRARVLGNRRRRRKSAAKVERIDVKAVLAERAGETGE